ncbi:unnamed protein product [Paramecium pentaurelia]|uniref:Protein kinase domain-containing protein n=1 Tax=Paramecium pentaurelia TaxID=43138 RepID=A0A8S1WJL3_9CILI|nr:unnamed protein product [Paramecium pentaurelia]
MSGQQEIREQYRIDTSTKNLIGQGGFGSVYKCQRKDGSDNDSLCIKIIKKDRNQMKQLKQEIEIQKLIMNLKTDKLLRTENIINTPHYFEVIMERCDMNLEQEFGNLKNKQQWYDFNDCLNIINQISVGCRILYEHNIVHRDIKPSNILVKLENKGQINERKLYKISDFDFSRILVDFLDPDEITTVGTPCYESPQIFYNQKYSGKCDIFSYGILFYQIFFNGQLPFNSIQNGKKEIYEFMKQLYNKQFKCELPNYPRAKEIADLLQKMIVYEEEERISFDQFFLHPIINLEEYEIYKIQQVQFRKYLLYNSICEKYENQDQILILSAVFCLQLLGDQELLYCMGFIHIIISDIHISYKQNKDITTIMRILQQCAQNINIYPQYQLLTKRIKQAYFQLKKKIFNLREQFRQKLNRSYNKNPFITEITQILEQSQYLRIQPQSIFDQLRSLLDQNLQEQ